jgi:hypothetical protein
VIDAPSAFLAALVVTLSAAAVDSACAAENKAIEYANCHRVQREAWRRSGHGCQKG